MAYTGDNLRQAWPFIQKLPDGVYFDVDSSGLQFQAEDQVGVHAITSALKLPAPWRKSYDKNVKWWEYENRCNGLNFRIYAVRQAPPTCRAIVETRKVEKKIPIQFETHIVEEDVIVGWDCSPEQEKEDSNV